MKQCAETKLVISGLQLGRTEARQHRLQSGFPPHPIKAYCITCGPCAWWPVHKAVRTWLTTVLSEMRASERNTIGDVAERYTMATILLTDVLIKAALA